MPKIVKVDETEESASAGQAAAEKTWVASAEAKKKALTRRLIAAGLWLVALGCEAAAIWFLRSTPINMVLELILIGVDLAFAIAGNLVWKSSNRFDPASKKQKFKFFVQNQLGVLISAICFIPLIVLILLNKDLGKREKTILTAVALVAVVAASLFGIDYSPPSVEEYAEQTAQVEALTGKNEVYWTAHGTKYHIYSTCYTINSDRTDEIIAGTVAQARELKNITELCKICENKAKTDPAFEDARNQANEYTSGGEVQDVPETDTTQP